MLLGVSSPSCWLRFDRAADPNSRLFRRHSSAAFLGGTTVEETVVVASDRDRLLPEGDAELCRVDLEQESCRIRIGDLGWCLLGINSLSPSYSLFKENCRFLARRLALDLLHSAITPMKSKPTVQVAPLPAAHWKGVAIDCSTLIAKLQGDRFGGRQQAEAKALTIAGFADEQLAIQLAKTGTPAAVTFCRDQVDACGITLPADDADLHRMEVVSPAELRQLLQRLRSLSTALSQAKQSEEALVVSGRVLHAYRVLATKLPLNSNLYYDALPAYLISYALRLQKADRFLEAESFLVESAGLAYVPLAASPQYTLSRLEQQATAFACLMPLQYQLGKHDEALATAEASYKAHCQLCALATSSRRDLVTACYWLAFLRARWLAGEIRPSWARVPDDGSEAFHAARSALVEEIDAIVSRQIDSEGEVENNSRLERQQLEIAKDDVELACLILLRAALTTVRLWRHAEGTLDVLESTDLAADIPRSLLNRVLAVLVAIVSALDPPRVSCRVWPPDEWRREQIKPH
jgi:hypothetical protein